MVCLILEDAERNPITNVILCGGRYDSTRGTYTPKNLVLIRLLLVCCVSLKYFKKVTLDRGKAYESIDILQILLLKTTMIKHRKI